MGICLGNRLRLLRKDENQNDFAARIGVDRTTLSSWETDRREPDLDTLSRIADMFNVSIDWLAGREVTPTVIPVLGTNDFINTATELTADFAIRITGNELVSAGLEAGDIALFKKASDTTQFNQIIAAKLVNETIVCFYSENLKAELLGTIVAIIRHPRLYDTQDLLQNDPKWREIIDLSVANGFTPEQVKRLLEAAAMMKK